MDVFFGKAGEEYTVEARVESVEVGATHVADTWLGLKERGDKVKGMTDTHHHGSIVLI